MNTDSLFFANTNEEQIKNIFADEIGSEIG
jgi:hypothetical protein